MVRDLPGVGGNLRDHPAVALVYRIDPVENEEHVVPIRAGLICTMPGSPFENDMQINPILFHSEHRPHALRLNPAAAYLGLNVAVMPDVTRNNINSTVMMIGERVAAMMAGEAAARLLILISQ